MRTVDNYPAEKQHTPLYLVSINPTSVSGGGKGGRGGVTTQLSPDIKLVISSPVQRNIRNQQFGLFFVNKIDPRMEKSFPFSLAGPGLAGLHAELDKQH